MCIQELAEFVEESTEQLELMQATIMNLQQQLLQVREGNTDSI